MCDNGNSTKRRDGITDADIQAAEAFAAEVLRGNGGGHDVSHVLRVERNALTILDGEVQNAAGSADKRLILLCCALHDVDDRKIRDAQAPPFSRLREFFDTVGLSERLFERVRDIISRVSFTDNRVKNSDLCTEAQIVQDADRLDALGAVGIARAFAYGGSVGRAMYGDGEGTTLAHFHDKLLLLHELMNTDTARRIAYERTEFMRKFLIEFISECG